jgi:hypothetical protein
MGMIIEDLVADIDDAERIIAKPGEKYYVLTETY